MELTLDPNSIEDYDTFLKVKRLPKYRIRGRQAWFPDEYASRLGMKPKRSHAVSYQPPEWMFDYQRDIKPLLKIN